VQTRQLRSQPLQIKRLVNSVARAGVGHGKIQQGLRWLTGTDPTKGDPSRREFAPLAPDIVLHKTCPLLVG
jgi:hypothetical protein